MSFQDGQFPVAYSTNSRFERKLVLPRSRRVRRGISKLAAEVNRGWINGGQPVSGLFTLVGKAERLPKHHAFRIRIAKLLRRRLTLRLSRIRKSA